MKKLITILAVAFYTLNLFAQTPQKTSFKAVIRDKDNNIVANKELSMRITLLKRNGPLMPITVVYQETHKSRTNSKGIIDLEIGKGETLSGVFANIDWSDAAFYIEAETNIQGDATYSKLVKSQVIGKPYVLFSAAEVNEMSQSLAHR
jgi:hypothetical protein